jgi:eukaryotic-like serine/threonine-protein kinase
LPISAFAHALRTFQSGHLTRDELSWELDRQLAIEKASPVALLEILKVQQVAKPLPSDAHEEILKHIADWPRDPTIVTGLTRQQRIERAPGASVGDILQGRFSLVALIGEGGMSRVFKAIDLRRVEAGAADSYVAVKVLTEPFNEYFGSIVALQREAHKLQSLTHPNIVRVIDCDRDGQTVFMTMEYLAGESLQKKLRAPGPSGFGSAAALALVAAVGEALEYAHRNRIVHGDLKPGNVIITDQGTVKVIDFGMARFITRPEGVPPAEPSQTMPKAVTPRYASPEMVAGHDPEPDDDVYALACMAYEALGRRHPFGRQSDPRGRDPHFKPPKPPGMATHQYAALVRALAFNRKNRTPSVRQFLDELLATRRDFMMKRWGWLVALTIAAIVAVVYWMRLPGG